MRAGVASVRADKQVPRRHSHVLCQLPLEGQVPLVGVGVLEILAHVQRERQDWTKAWKCLVVEALASRLILRTARHARGAIDSRYRAGEVTGNHGALNTWTAFRSAVGSGLRDQDPLLLLHGVGDI